MKQNKKQELLELHAWFEHVCVEFWWKMNFEVGSLFANVEAIVARVQQT